MGCETENNNATPASPAIAPGAEGIDARTVAEAIGVRGIDPRVTAVVPSFDAPFFQAGLAGYSDASMRIIARRHGCPFCVTEALLDRTLLAGGRGFAKADLGELHDNVPGGEEDSPIAGQIMGSDPEEMAAAALKMIEQGRRGEKAYRAIAYEGREALAQEAASQHLRLPGGEQVGRIGAFARDSLKAVGRTAHSGDAERDAAQGFATIDINFACPVKKVASKARGGHWLAEPDGAIRILERVRDSVPSEIPITVKLRRSFDDTPEMAGNFARLLDAAFEIGCAWATVHARTVEQKYVGPSRWDLLRDIVRSRPNDVIFGSGDVWEAADIFRMIAYTGVSAVSVARGCIGNPWIFRQARAMMAGDGDGATATPTLAEQRTVLLEHFRLALSVNSRARDPEHLTGRTMRKFAIRFAHFHPQAEDVRRRFIGVTSREEWEAVLAEWYSGA